MTSPQIGLSRSVTEQSPKHPSPPPSSLLTAVIACFFFFLFSSLYQHPFSTIGFAPYPTFQLGSAHILGLATPLLARNRSQAA